MPQSLNLIEQSYAMLWKEDSVFNHSCFGGLIFDNMTAVPAQHYENRGDALIVKCAGTYKIEWKLFVPSGAPLETRIALQEGACNAPAAALTIRHARYDGDCAYCAKTLLTLLCGASIRLSSSKVIALRGERGDTLASLSLLRVQ